MTQRRAPPRKHHVNTHYRQGKKIDSYLRGVPKTQIKKTKPHKVFDNTTKMGPKAFTINFSYDEEGKDGESVVVIADSYDAALEEGFEERVDTRQPIIVELVDPDLGAALEFIKESAAKVAHHGVKATERGAAYALKGIEKSSKLGKKAAKLGAKYSIKAAKGAKKVGKAFGVATYKTGKKVLGDASKVILSEAEKRIVQEVLKDCYSDNPAKANAAIYNLKKNWPKVYEICSFSKPNEIPLARQETPSQIYIDARPRR